MNLSWKGFHFFLSLANFKPCLPNLILTTWKLLILFAFMSSTGFAIKLCHWILKWSSTVVWTLEIQQYVEYLFLLLFLLFVQLRKVRESFVVGLSFFLATFQLVVVVIFRVRGWGGEIVFWITSKEKQIQIRLWTSLKFNWLLKESFLYFPKTFNGRRNVHSLLKIIPDRRDPFIRPKNSISKIIWKYFSLRLIDFYISLAKYFLFAFKSFIAFLFITKRRNSIQHKNTFFSFYFDFNVACDYF